MLRPVRPQNEAHRQQVSQIPLVGAQLRSFRRRATTSLKAITYKMAGISNAIKLLHRLNTT